MPVLRCSVTLSCGLVMTMRVTSGSLTETTLRWRNASSSTVKSSATDLSTTTTRGASLPFVT